MFNLRRPKCPDCHRPISLLESYRARASRFPCPTCGTELRIPKAGQAAAAIPLYFGFRGIFATTWPLWQQIALVLGIGIAVILLEYYTISMIAHRSAKTPE